MSSDDQDPPCKLYALTQYQCSPRGGKITCWPLERIFRQCGERAPMIEVTSHVEPSAEDPSKPVLTDQIKENPPRGKLWSNLSPESRHPEIKNWG
ncbi:hypothetical protein FFLO_03122 [Filobasidium floriforme]|uniref:Uncharacterized protein n=1 Tax=Filobasidium floriforme TaxID=5210 RepID=A0A8K0JLB2_9TREE|nr:uncharacterized protein HD553DRAFT_102886 [Filobasidium floriforme]KAG7549009.1 hypothetical protein FFLO_03122 [Filobasidium floriforme]KAH8089769.1 hypothetical protein HD553DRAFT_102886 [Filobasidium floriforme]